MDLRSGAIPIKVGSIPHRVAFPNFDEASVENKIVALPEKLQETFPKIPGVIKGKSNGPVKKDMLRNVPYVEYSFKPKEEPKEKKKGKKKKGKK